MNPKSTHKFTVLEKRSDSIKVEIEILVQHRYYPYVNPSSMLQFLVDTYQKIQYGHAYHNQFEYYPFSEAEAARLLRRNDHKMNALIDLLYPEKMVTEEAYGKITSAGTYNRRIKGKRVIEHWIGQDAYHVMFETAYDNFCKKAEELIAAVTCVSTENYPYWNKRLKVWLDHSEYLGSYYYYLPREAREEYTDEPNPKYTVEIKVKKGNKYLLDHITTETTWQEELPDLEYAARKYKAEYPKKRFLLEPATIENSQTDGDIWEWWSKLDQNWQNALSINFGFQTKFLWDRLVSRAINTDINKAWTYLSREKHITPVDKKEQLLLPKLKGLFASYAKLDSLKPLTMIKGLELIDLKGNPIKDISPLKELPELKFLCLSECPLIGDWSPLEQLSQLKHLVLELENEDFSFERLANLKQLRNIQISAQGFKNWEVLLKLDNLKKVKVRFNASTTNKTIPPEDMVYVEQLKQKEVVVEHNDED